MAARISLLLLICAAVVGCEKGAPPPQTGAGGESPPSPPPETKYDPVTADDVPNLKLNHYFTSTVKGNWPDFKWTFTKDGFTIKKDVNPIPADLIKKLLPDGATADEITGKWKLEDGKIVFTDVKAAGKSGREKVSLSIARTGPTVVRIGDPQYVFEVERK